MNDETLTELEKPFSPSCERNQEAILGMLKQQLRPNDQHLLEIGSGTGQHAVYLGQHLPQLIWYTSDVSDNHAGIKLWLSEAGLTNVMPPFDYEIGLGTLPKVNIDVVFSANTLHIISELLVNRLIENLGQSLKIGSRVIFYGPFKYHGEFTSESNAEFDLWLKDTDPLRGVRDCEMIGELMGAQKFVMLQDIQMPANNQLLLFEKT